MLDIRLGFPNFSTRPRSFRSLRVLRAFVALLLLSAATALAGYDGAGIGGNWLIDAYKSGISPLQNPNTCNFWPTCSQFGKQAVRQSGLLAGMVMTADRLTRCHPGAWSYYDKYYLGISHERLNDPVAQSAPEELTPHASRSTRPDSSHLTSDIDISGTFADYLYSSGDYRRAASEYLRQAYAAAGAERDYSTLMAAEALLSAGDLERSRAVFGTAADATLSGFGIARTQFGQGDFAACRSTLSPLPDTPERRLLDGWMLFRDYRFRDAALRFSQEPAGTELAALATLDGTGLPRRSRVLSTALSAVVPGLGQVYCGRVVDGLYSFLAVAGPALATWWYAAEPARRDRTRIKVSIAALFTALFYSGNLYGANVAARDYNRYQQRQYVARAETVLVRHPLVPDYRRALGLDTLDRN